MDYLNLVFSALTLLATVTLGVIQITWMIARDVFRWSVPENRMFR